MGTSGTIPHRGTRKTARRGEAEALSVATSRAGVKIQCRPGGNSQLAPSSAAFSASTSAAPKTTRLRVAT
jgi:hypothetical protein